MQGAVSDGVASVFQFTPLREGRRTRFLCSANQFYFNSRPSARGDSGGIYYEQKQSNFNSRPSARGDVLRSSCRYQSAFQFTPLREGRPCRVLSSANAHHISIHAPPRGATSRQASSGSAWTFQFTPLREGRHSHRHAAQRSRAFQFTPLREGRRSILAKSEVRTYFNSRPSARGDSSPCACVRLIQFQFTPLREGRQRGFAALDVEHLFQFTPLREGRLDCM